MNSCNVGCSYSATLTTATSIEQWSCQQCREKSKQIFLAYLKAHQFKFRDKQDCSATFTAPKGKKIDRNCDMLPLSLDDLLNYTTSMLKFCTNKPIWASLLRQVIFFGGGKGGVLPQKRV
jgi:hypothetical protein